MVLALMLFAQAALAWSACVWEARAPDRAVRAVAAATPCHNDGSAAACLTHCLSDRQTVHKVMFDIPAMPSDAVLTLALPRDRGVDLASDRSARSMTGTSPPRRILLQSFQI
jgi:hypothetical protein